MVSQAYSGMPRYVLAFLHPRQPSSLLHLGKRDFGWNDVLVASSKLRFNNGRENLNDGNTVHMLRLRLVVGKVVPSLGSGGGNTLTRG